MTRGVWHVDATTFLGMHHQNSGIRRRSLALFRCALSHAVTMNLEQIGLCDAVVWHYPRHIQDAYYPFMDVLHSELHMARPGYERADLALARASPTLRDMHPRKALLAAQVINRSDRLFTHDPALHELGVLKPYLGDFGTLVSRAPPEFPDALAALYARSRNLIITERELRNVLFQHPCSSGYATG